MTDLLNNMQSEIERLTRHGEYLRQRHGKLASMAADEAPAAAGNHDRLCIRKVIEDLQGDGPLPRHDVGVVERAHEEPSPLARQGLVYLVKGLQFPARLALGDFFPNGGVSQPGMRPEDRGTRWRRRSRGPARRAS